MTSHISVDGAADHYYSDLDVTVYQCRGVDDQRSFLRQHLAGNMAVDPEHVFETNFAVELRLRVIRATAGALFESERAATGAQVSRNYSIHRHQPPERCLAGHDGNAGLKVGTVDVAARTRHGHRWGRRTHRRHWLFIPRRPIGKVLGTLICWFKLQNRLGWGHRRSPQRPLSRSQLWIQFVRVGRTRFDICRTGLLFFGRFRPVWRAQVITGLAGAQDLSRQRCRKSTRRQSSTVGYLFWMLSASTSSIAQMAARFIG